MKEMVSVEQVKNFTKRKLLFLIAQSKENTAVLAELRRGVGKIPGELPGLSGYFMEGMPEDSLDRAEPSRAEWLSIQRLHSLPCINREMPSMENSCMKREAPLEKRFQN